MKKAKNLRVGQLRKFNEVMRPLPEYRVFVLVKRFSHSEYEILYPATMELHRYTRFFIIKNSEFVA